MLNDYAGFRDPSKMTALEAASIKPHGNTVRPDDASPPKVEERPAVYARCSNCGAFLRLDDGDAER